MDRDQVNDTSLLLRFGSVLLAFQNFLNNLGLFNQKGPNDPVTNAVSATRAAIRSLNGFDSLRNGGVSNWPESRYSGKSGVTITTFWGGSLLVKSKVPELSARSLDDSSEVGGGVVGFPGTESDSLNHFVLRGQLGGG